MGSSTSGSAKQAEIDRLKREVESQKQQLARWQDAVKRARANKDKSGVSQAQSAVEVCKRELANAKARLANARK